jgi:predicted house-cleaning NTP pyrophosphatase (Maf/HAM1 superfamily)
MPSGGPHIMDEMKPHLILASASPRRRQLLAEAGYSFEVDPSDVDEPEPEERNSPERYVAELAWRKPWPWRADVAAG